MPKVSVILPTYNRAAMLPSAVESVLSQTFQDWELIVIDDGSSDQTPDVVAKIMARDLRIRSYRQANSGLPATRAKGVELAVGEYIAFLDDDDSFAPDKLERQAAYLEAHSEMDLVYSHVETKGENCPLPEKWPDKPADNFFDLVKQCTIQPNAVLVRSKAFEKFGNFRTKLKSGDDYEMWLRIAAKGRLAFLPGVVGTYHWHSKNMSRNGRQRSKSNLKIYRSLLSSDIAPQDKKLIREYVGFKNYMQASDAFVQKRYDAARYHFLSSLLIDPKIGLSVPWNNKAPRVYRFLRPYFGMAYTSLLSIVNQEPGK